ncbi:isoprenylcysteine carboxylmethyltransferase family protein [Hasllibacter sp. MH4015]|uniref:methyltransferase family protein n=1 Tax=Hasllibacter sp. MH4015 TaxID=2854029 RepID=UPI001CD68EB5|nr:methyltransferase [Hasllibacter sp. MH4015]
MKGFPDLPPIWLVGFMALAWVLARFVPLYEARDALVSVLGMAMGVVGVVLIFWAAYWFWKKKTTIEPHHTPGTLIVEGPYTVSRNPIYLGMVFILTGQVLWMGALSPILLPPALLLILTRRFARPEEAALRAAFGAEAQRYLAETRRWL